MTARVSSTDLIVKNDLTSVAKVFLYISTISTLNWYFLLFRGLSETKKCRIPTRREIFRFEKMVSENASMALDDYIAKSKIGKGGRGNNRGGRGTFWVIFGVFSILVNFLVFAVCWLFSCNVTLDGGGRGGGNRDRGGDRGRVQKRRNDHDDRGYSRRVRKKSRFGFFIFACRDEIWMMLGSMICIRSMFDLSWFCFWV